MPPAVENAVPTLKPAGSATAVAGDGNGDGIPDSQQSAVVSIPLKISSTPNTASDTTPQTYITLVAASVNGKVGSAETTQITNVQQLDAPANLPASVSMPMGLIAFKSTVPVTGALSTYSLYVDASLDFNGYWKQNKAGVWTNLASAAYGGSITQEGGKIRIDFKIQDGSEFDADGLANGVIADPGAVGKLPLSLMGTVANMPDGHGWF
ncbi:MAG: choice-of-anchor U domain-containing protein [Bacteroidota bacterium]